MSKRAFKNKHEYDAITVDQIEQSQLAHNNNDVDVRSIAESPDIDNRVALSGKNKNYGAETKGVSEFEKYAEMSRFNKSHEIDESAIRKNEKMKLNQKVDHI